jgi:hypothetical protein
MNGKIIRDQDVIPKSRNIFIQFKLLGGGKHKMEKKKQKKDVKKIKSLKQNDQKDIIKIDKIEVDSRIKEIFDNSYKLYRSSFNDEQEVS